MRCHDVPEPTIVPFAAAVDDGLIAMQDNLCLSAARVSLDITEEDTNIMDWSASTQDPNLGRGWEACLRTRTSYKDS